MTELLSILYKLRIFTSDELSEALKGKVKSVRCLLGTSNKGGLWLYGAIPISRQPRKGDATGGDTQLFP